MELVREHFQSSGVNKSELRLVSRLGPSMGGTQIIAPHCTSTRFRRLSSKDWCVPSQSERCVREKSNSKNPYASNLTNEMSCMTNKGGMQTYWKLCAIRSSASPSYGLCSNPWVWVWRKRNSVLNSIVLIACKAFFLAEISSSNRSWSLSLIFHSRSLDLGRKKHLHSPPSCEEN